MTFVAGLCLSLFSVSSAQASLGVVNFWGNPSSAASVEGGKFSTTPGGLAVNSEGHGTGVAPGDVYVVDKGNNRVEQFSASGAFVQAFGLNVGGVGVNVCTVPASCAAASASALNGGMSAPQGVAIDQVTGNLYVTDQGNKRVDVFAANGIFEGAWGQNVDATTAGTGFEFCPAADTCQAGASTTTGVAGAFGAALGYPAVVPGPTNAGNVIVADSSNNRIDEFSVTITAGAVTGAGFVRGIGWKVKSTGAAEELQVCTVGTGCQAGSAGGNPGQFTASGASRVAADSTGSIYALNFPTGTPSCTATTVRCAVWKFNATATSAVDFAPSLLSFTSGAKATKAATDVAVDPVGGHVYVVRPFAAGTGEPAAEVTERRVLEFDSSGVLQATHMVNAGINAVNGLALDGPGGPSGRIYVTSTTIAPRVYALGNGPAPLATVGTPTDVTSEEATLHGTVSPSVNPAGFKTFYRFEYSRNGFEWSRAPATDVGLGNGAAAGVSATCPAPEAASCEVSQHLTGLEPGQEYETRVFAHTEFNGASVMVAGPNFTTPLSVPTVTTGGALWSSPAATGPSLLFAGQINPKHGETTYSFEYVSDATFQRDVEKDGAGHGFDHAVATPTGQAGHRVTAISVQQSVFGLDASGLYHYRLVASNPAGTTFGVERTVSSPSAGQRFYELVSNGDSWGSGVSAGLGPISDEGDRAQFSAKSFGQPQGDPGVFTRYTARRRAGGWSVTPMSPLPDRAEGEFQVANGLEAMPSADLGSELWPESSPGERMRGEVQWAITHLDGTRTNAFPFIVPLAHANGNNAADVYSSQGASLDLSAFVFRHATGEALPTGVRLLPDEPLLEDPIRSNLYEVSGAATASPSLDIVNRASNPSPGVDGAILGGSCGAGLGSETTGSVSLPVHRHAVSSDGSTVYFTAFPGAPPVGSPCSESSGARLYKRIGNETTVQVSESRCNRVSPACAGSGGDVYTDASADGSVVFFESARQLTNSDEDATKDLYEFDAKLGASERLVQVSAGETVGAHTAGSGAKVLRTLGASADGSRVYFVAEGALTGQNAELKSPEANKPNLYVYERDGAHPGGRIAFIRTLATSDAFASAQVLPRQGTVGDGHFLLFVSAAPLVGADGDSSNDVYRYDDSNSQLLCLSCPGGGADPGKGNGAFDVGIAHLQPSNSELGWADAAQVARPASADVSTVVFTTREQLLAADQNTAPDVYMWHSGVLSLVTGGTEQLGVEGAAREVASGISPDGQDVFFTTAAALVASDVNGQVDLYDARVDGGFPAVPKQAATCDTDEGCHGSQVAPTVPVAPTSSTFFGSGNQAAPPLCGKGKVRRHGRCVKKPKRQTKKHRKQAKRVHFNRGGHR